MLSGAGLIKGKDDSETVHVHMTTNAQVSADDLTINLKDALQTDETVDKTAPIFVCAIEADGSLTGDAFDITNVADQAVTVKGKKEDNSDVKGKLVLVDYYVIKKGSTVSELQIDAENFAGYYYVEADTLFRRQNDGVDLPAVITIPNVKIQSNFSFAMAATGDPSTFTFTMDAMPGYTYFNPSKKVLCVIQIIEDATNVKGGQTSVMAHSEGEKFDLDGIDGDDKFIAEG